MYNFSMSHPESLKSVPRGYAADGPLPPDPEFPGCTPVHLPRGEVEAYEGRLEFWDARTETAWVCEPTSPYHEQPSHTLAALVGLIATLQEFPARLGFTAGFWTTPALRRPRREGESTSTDRRAGAVRQAVRTSAPPRRISRRLRGRHRRLPLRQPTPVRLPQAAGRCRAPGPARIDRRPGDPDERPERHGGRAFWSGRMGHGRTRWPPD